MLKKDDKNYNINHWIKELDAQLDMLDSWPNPSANEENSSSGHTPPLQYESAPLMDMVIPDCHAKEDHFPNMATISRKIMPVFFVLDCSGSMTGPWISALNEAMRNTIGTLKAAQYHNPDTDIRIALLQVNSYCRWLIPSLTPINDILWDDLTAGGLTSFGESFRELNNQLRPKGFQSNTSYFAPVIIFTADGSPTDFWEEPFESLKQNPWYQKAIKIAIGISNGADEAFLAKVAGNPKSTLLFAQNAGDIISRFQETIPFMSIFEVEDEFLPPDFYEDTHLVENYADDVWMTFDGW